MKTSLSMLVCVLSWSCAESEYANYGLDSPSSESGDPITIEEKRRSGNNTCDTRWVVQADSPNAQSIPYASARSCTGRATEGAKILSAFIQREFRQVIHPDRAQPIEIYNCRQIANSRNYSVHSEGRALDIYIKTIGGSADNRRGDLLANWLAANAAYVGIQYIIWDRTS